MKILVVNDDSIHAPGIALLAKAAMELGEVTVVAPAHQCSAMSQKITIRGDMRVDQVADFPVPVKAAYMVDGTPADCVKIAMQYLLEERPDYVFSGINDGYNAGFDIAYSGTLGAAFEAVMNGVPLDSGYGTAFSYAAAEQVDIIVCYADGRNDYEASWTLPVDQKDETGKQGMGRSESIWNELNVIGVTDGIYNDTVAISKESPYYTPELIDALQQCFINIINTDEGQAIFSVYSHTGYAIAKDSDYDGARAALEVVS